MRRSEKTIVIFTRKMNGVMGGLERQILEITKMLSQKNYVVYVITFDQESSKPFYVYNDVNLNVINIGIGNPDIPATFIVKIRRQLAILNVLKRLKPDVGIAFMYGGYLMSRPAMFLINRPLVLAERNSPSMYSLTRISRFRNFLFFTMIFANKITVQFDSYKSKYPWYLRRKILTIPNTILDLGILQGAAKGKVRYVYAGRFSFQKQILKVVEAFRVFHTRFPESILMIYGEGEQKNMIEEKIQNYEMQDYVGLFGPSSIEEILKNADVVCVPSKWEGFPNTLAESLRAGIPAIGFSNCDGVGNLIEDNVNGWTEKDDDSIGVIITLLERSFSAIKSGTMDSTRVRKSMEPYNSQEISIKWDNLMKSLIRE
jgi:glycosyltransferase involved in cell wall biosynthesis